MTYLTRDPPDPEVLAGEAANDRLHVAFRAAPPLTLHDERQWRTDGNSPVQIDRSGSTVFFSDYQPRGHTYRRHGPRDLRFESEAVAVRLLSDPEPQTGKWIEAVWQDAAARVLRGWYHAEEPAPGNPRLVVPHIGELSSDDGGITWHCRGEVLRSPLGQIDGSWRNGFFAGGYGDLSVVPDRLGHSLYLFFTSYLREERSQGIGLARLPLPRHSCPTDGLDLWCGDAWRPAADHLPVPLWPMTRGWRHVDPDGYWGPAVHYNWALDSYVMLLNRTAGGSADFVQEGIYASVNTTLEDPAGWSPPLRIVRGGAWYPQVIGLEAGCGDTQAAALARFFMAGFSGWTIEFSGGLARRIERPLSPTKQDFANLFGPARRCPW